VATSLRLLTPRGSLIRCQSVQVYYRILLFWSVGPKVQRVANAPISLALKLLLVVSPSISERANPLHNDQSLTFGNPQEILTAHFTTSYSRVCMRASYNVFTLPRCSCWIMPCSLMSLLHSTPFCRLFLTTGPLWLRPLYHAIPAWRVIHLWAAANFFQNTPSSWVHFFDCRRRPTARCQSPHQSSSAPIVSTAASSLGT
jgi:hypothetical protein